MSSWSNVLGSSQAVGVIIGGAIVSAQQTLTERRSRGKDAKASAAKADADWAALQISTIMQLQEELEAVSAFIGDVMSQPNRPWSFAKPKDYLPWLERFGRAGMLCSRLEDRDLAERVRTWLVSIREWAESAPAVKLGGDNAKIVELREVRIGTIEDLGVLLLSYHRRPG